MYLLGSFTFDMYLLGSLSQSKRDIRSDVSFALARWPLTEREREAASSHPILDKAKKPAYNGHRKGAAKSG